MATPQERVVEWDMQQVGYVPPYGKYNKYAEYLDQTPIYNGKKNGYDWCDIYYDCGMVQTFDLDVAVEMMNQPLNGCGAGCDFSASYYRAANQWSSSPSLGAQIFFGTRGDEYHTGRVVGFDDYHVHTVEGNTGYSAGYSGGAVLKQTYGRDDGRICGYGVPKWSLAGGDDGVAPVELTNVYEATGQLEVDGYLGVQSVTAWQRALGTYDDGFVSGQDWADSSYTPRLVSVERCYGGGGSSLVRAIQRKVGMSWSDVDGLMGPQTVRCIQSWLYLRGYDCGESGVDGVLGECTAKAIQRSLNDGAWS